jgi:hypothetical protein
MRKGRPHILAVSLLVWGCAPGGAEVQATTRSDAGAPAEAAAKTPATKDVQRLVHLEARFGSPSALWGEATYKVKRVNGERFREMEVEVENAEPGSRHDLSLDGYELGAMIVNLKGEAEYEVSEEDEQLFPVGFPEPKAGSVFRVGELMELRLDELEWLTALEVRFSGEGGASGKVGFKIERLGDEVTREFKAKLESATPRAVHAVSVDGFHVGDLRIDLEGEGKLAFSTKNGMPFPEGFPEPHAGSRVEVGDVFRGELLDVREAATGGGRSGR